MSETKTRTTPERHTTTKKHVRRKKSYNNVMILCLLVLSLIAIVALGINTVRVARASNYGQDTNTLEVDTQSSMSNDLYEIGNNPTEIQKTYFQELTDALKGDDQALIAEKVAMNFVADFFTWTNKDGNYEVGGLQYIYGPHFLNFDTYARWNYYADLDKYIHQYGRENLLQVKEITVEVPTAKTDDYMVYTVDPAHQMYAWKVELSWTYEDTKLDASSFPQGGQFIVALNDNRFEIVEFYDIESVREWEANHPTETQENDSDSDEEVEA